MGCQIPHMYINGELRGRAAAPGSGELANPNKQTQLTHARKHTHKQVGSAS